MYIRLQKSMIMCVNTSMHMRCVQVQVQARVQVCAKAYLEHNQSSILFHVS
jgi:hypothetical protein